jgi:hypothetical protein
MRRYAFRSPFSPVHILALPLMMILTGTLAASEQDVPVPPELQAAIFQKVFSYDRSLPSGQDPKVLIAFAPASAPFKDRLLKAFEQVGIRASAVREEEVASHISAVEVLYVATDGTSFKALCQKNAVLSITGFPSLVEKGEVSVGLGVVADKPKILVHLPQLRAEGHELSANLLQLARVIQ